MASQCKELQPLYMTFSTCMQMQAEKGAALLEKEAAKQQAAHLQKAIEG